MTERAHLVAEIDLQTHTRWIRNVDPLNIYRYSGQLYGSFRFSDGDGAPARVHAWSPDCLDAEIDGLRHRARVTRHGAQLLVQGPGGDLELVQKRLEGGPFAQARIDPECAATLAPAPERVLEELPLEASFVQESVRTGTHGLGD